VAWLRGEIRKKFKVFRRFYEAVYTEARKHEYAIYEQPRSEDSVARAFAATFSGDRSLPDVYEVALCVVLKINEDSLPWRRDQPAAGRVCATPPAAEVSSAPPPASAPSSLDLKVPSTTTGSPLRDKLTPDLFKRLTTPEIKGHIAAALVEFRGPNWVAETESLLPETIGILAEKLVHEPVENFVDFYAGDFDSPPKIKQGVAACIAANPILRAELAAKVARSGYRNLVGWFQVFSHFCPHEIAVQVELAFLEFEHEPAFQEEYGWRGVHGLTSLISHFWKFGCAGAAHTLKELCFQDVIRHIEQGDPIPTKELEPFAVLVGEKAFQDRIDGSLDRRAANVLSQVIRPVPGKR